MSSPLCVRGSYFCSSPSDSFLKVSITASLSDDIGVPGASAGTESYAESCFAPEAACSIEKFIPGRPANQAPTEAAPKRRTASRRVITGILEIFPPEHFRKTTAIQKIQRRPRMNIPKNGALLAEAVREYPFDQNRLGESPLPDFMVHACVFGIERMASRFASGSDTFARYGHRNGLVGVSVKAPQRRLQRFGAVFGGFASATRDCGGEKVRPSRDYVPHSRAAHRLTRHVNSSVVNGKFTASSVDHFHCHARA